MSGVLENLKKRMDAIRKKVVDNPDGDLYCIKCGAEEELVEDSYNEEVYYCLTCLEKSWRHDEMIIEGFEEAPDVGD